MKQMNVSGHSFIIDGVVIKPMSVFDSDTDYSVEYPRDIKSLEEEKPVKENKKKK